MFNLFFSALPVWSKLLEEIFSFNGNESIRANLEKAICQHNLEINKKIHLQGLLHNGKYEEKLSVGGMLKAHTRKMETLMTDYMEQPLSDIEDQLLQLKQELKSEDKQKLMSFILFIFSLPDGAQILQFLLLQYTVNKRRVSINID